MPDKIDFNSIHLTADDWGISSATNQGILDLARLKILRRISVLSTLTKSQFLLDELKAIQNLSLGLHFNLTDLEIRRSPQSVLTNWFFGGRHFKKFVFLEFEKQLQAFWDLGLKPTHLDGHEHIHLLPGLFNEVAPLCRSAGLDTIRLPLDWDLTFRPQAPIIFLSLAARPVLERLGFKSLPFAYPSAKEFQDSKRLTQYLREHLGYEVILHPAQAIDDELKQYDHRFLNERFTQYQALKSLVA